MNTNDMRALIEQAARGGPIEVSALAIRINKPVREVEQLVSRHREELLAAAPPDKRLRSYLDTIHEMVDLARETYAAEPAPENASALATLVKTAQDLIGDLEGRDDPTDLYEAVMGSIQHLVHNHVKVATQETQVVQAKLREMAARGEITPEASAFLMSTLDQTALAVASRANDQYAETKHELAVLMGIESGAGKLQVLDGGKD